MDERQGALFHQSLAHTGADAIAGGGAQSGNDEVADLQWSPSNSTVLGTVTADGRLEIWDLAASTLKPALHTRVPNTKLTCMLFLEGDPIVMTGGALPTLST